MCWYRFTFSWLYYCDSNECLNRNRCWRATTAWSNWQLWGCKPIPPFAHQRPRLGYPWQDLDRELSANFGYFRCFPPPSPLQQQFTHQSCRRCCVAGPDNTTALTSQIKWTTQINSIIVTKVVMQMYSNSTALQLRESLYWRSYHKAFLNNDSKYHFALIISYAMDWAHQV